MRISSVLSKVEPEPDFHTGSGSDQKVPAPAPQHFKEHIYDLVLRVQNCLDSTINLTRLKQNH